VPPKFTQYVDLASERLGAQVLSCSDDFFAEKENLIKFDEPIFIVDKYTDNGKWMDGWESRRRRTPGHDWCVVKLGFPGRIHGVEVNTAFFKGNYPESCWIEAVHCMDGEPKLDSPWKKILAKKKLKGDSQHFFKVDSKDAFTHVRLNIDPDGGVARLRVHGEVLPHWETLMKQPQLDLAFVGHGGRAEACNDEFFGKKGNLLLPNRARNMGEGWETRRRRGKGHDWVVIKLGRKGLIQGVEVDTLHFKGNYPDHFTLEAAVIKGEKPKAQSYWGKVKWKSLLKSAKLEAHQLHKFGPGSLKEMEATHVRLKIFPDGGVSRLRIHGEPR